jgi:predicted hotdog family 3-hydroxylacyl-ACP dehydratase
MTTTTTDPTHPTESFLRSIDIHTLLPQQEPFVMAETLVEYSADTTATETRIKPTNLFVETDGKGFCVLSSEGLIENIAQTCATRIGYVNRYILKKGVEIGFIGSVRHFRVTRLPRVGELIRTSVKIEQEIFGMTLATATVASGKETLAHTEIKIAVKEGEQV